MCEICFFSIEVVICVSNRGLIDLILLVLKLVVCKRCNVYFVDNLLLLFYLKVCCIIGVRNFIISLVIMLVI